MLKESPTFSAIRTPSSYPASHKRFLLGDRGDMRVPYREITLSTTHHTDRTEENPSLPVYDTSGPYTDADVRIDLSRGLPHLRTEWIKRRDDTEILGGHNSEYARERERDLLTHHLRFPSPSLPAAHAAVKLKPDALCAKGHYHAGDEICCLARIDAADKFAG